MGLRAVKFTATELGGAWWIDPEAAVDERGTFGRIFDEQAFQAHGLCARFPQVSLSSNTRAGTLRGLHFQANPHGETKLVTCVRGAVFDVVVDLRSESPTRHRWLVTELTAQNQRLLYVPEGFAHGFVSMEDQTTLLYQLSAVYKPEAARGLRWDDPLLTIPWPPGHKIISGRDRDWPWLTGGNDAPRGRS